MFSFTSVTLLYKPGPRFLLFDKHTAFLSPSVCDPGQYIYVTDLFNFSFVSQDFIDRINSFFPGKTLQRNLLLIVF